MKIKNQVKRQQILFQEYTENKLIGVDESGKSHKFSIDDPWVEFLKYLEPFDILLIEHVGGRVDNRGFMVIEPHYLVAVTSVIDSITCPRKVYVKSLGADQLMDANIRKRVVEGNLLHDVFSKLVATDMDVESAIDSTLAHSELDLLHLQIEKDEAHDYLQKDTGPLSGLSIRGDTELDCQNWHLGLHGKFDGISGNQIIELKSSKIPQTTPWPSHNIQMNMYTQMMKKRGVYTGSVLYINDGEMGLKLPTVFERNQSITARNYSYLVLTKRYTPPVLRGDKLKECRTCFVKEGCRKLCAGLGTQRDCQNCYHEFSCDKNLWSYQSLNYFSTFNSSLYAEEIGNIRESYTYSRVGIRDEKHRKKLLENGYAVETREKLSEKLIDGYYVSQFSQYSTIPRFRSGDRIRAYNIGDTHDFVTLYYTAVILEINDESIILRSENSLPQKLALVPANISSVLRRSRFAVFQAVQQQQDSILMQIIVKSYSEKKFKLEDIKNTDTKIIDPLKMYNSDQEQAIRFSLSTPDIFLIQGPAGTGKTSVIIELVNQILKRGKSVLCTAYTNMAVDNIGLKLIENDLDFVRLGYEYSISTELRDHIISNRREYYSEVIQNKGGYVVLSTTSTIARDVFQDLRFDYVIIDEAAQMTEPDSIKPILLSEKAIFVGDHAQLQPIISSQEALDKGLQISLFERLVNQFPNRYSLLSYQYRMNDEILSFPNHRFYEGKLKSASVEIGHKMLNLPEKLQTIEKNNAYQVFSVSQESNGTISQINLAEIAIVIKILYDLIVLSELDPTEIGIITPFRAQVAKLRSFLPKSLIKIDTVDRFQGSEKPVIIFSTITSLEVPILTDERRLNVALTRAQKLLTPIVTNPTITGKTSIIQELYADAKLRGLVTSEFGSDVLDESLLNTQLQEIWASCGLSRDPVSRFRLELEVSSVKINSIDVFFDSIQLIIEQLSTPETCMICFSETDNAVSCPGCLNYYHQEHLITWLQSKPFCPVCKHHLSLV